MFDAANWRRRFFATDAFVARDHVLILCSEDDEATDRLHVHTRGLRKFARPDIDIRNVPAAAADAAGALASRFVSFQCDGGLVPDGHPIEVEGVPAGMQVRHAGSLDDPAFNNRHLALRWPD
jgi:hypothetical protein